VTVSCKCSGFLDCLEDLLASKEAICTMGLWRYGVMGVLHSIKSLENNYVVFFGKLRIATKINV